MPGDIHVEIIFPRLISRRAGLQLGEVDIAGGELLETVVERPRFMLQRKDDRCLVVPGGHGVFFGEDEEPREVMGVILDFLSYYLHAIYLGGTAAGNSGAVGQILLLNHPDAAGSIGLGY